MIELVLLEVCRYWVVVEETPYRQKQKDASDEQEAAVADWRQKSYLIYSSFISTRADTQFNLFTRRRVLTIIIKLFLLTPWHLIKTKLSSIKNVLSYQI